MRQLVIFALDEHQFALDLSHVEKAVISVEIDTMPNSSGAIVGMINLHGKVIPVFNLRKAFHLPEKELDLNDQFIICIVNEKKFALWVDFVLSVDSIVDKDIHNSGETLFGVNDFDYFLNNRNKTVLIYNLENLLTEEVKR